MAAHIALWEAGAEFAARPISFARCEQSSAELLAFNPAGKVPILLIDQQPLTEVAAILYYLAARFPESKLLPQSIEARAQEVSWMSFIASTVHPARRQGWKHVRGVYALVEQRLNGQSWAVQTYSIADIHLFRLYWRIRNAFAPDPQDFPSLEAHYARMMQRPAVQQVCKIESQQGYKLQGWRDP